jgi:hypothetical protein
MTVGSQLFFGRWVETEADRSFKIDAMSGVTVGGIAFSSVRN